MGEKIDKRLTSLNIWFPPHILLSVLSEREDYLVILIKWFFFWRFDNILKIQKVCSKLFLFLLIYNKEIRKFLY
jgi:hypothetical protein